MTGRLVPHAKPRFSKNISYPNLYVITYMFLFLPTVDTKARYKADTGQMPIADISVEADDDDDDDGVEGIQSC